MLIPVILSGGVGPRLSPLTRATHPKPSINLADGQVFSKETLLRAINLPEVSGIDIGEALSVMLKYVGHPTTDGSAREPHSAGASQVLGTILDAEISPEWVPGESDAPRQAAENFVGPYARQDFNLFISHALIVNRPEWLL